MLPLSIFLFIGIGIAAASITPTPADAVREREADPFEIAPPPAPPARLLRVASPSSAPKTAPGRWAAASAGSANWRGERAESHPLAEATLQLLEGEATKSWGSSPRFRIVAVTETPRVTFVRGRQIVRGLPVIGTALTASWQAPGRVVMLRTDAFPGVDAAWPDIAVGSDRAGSVALEGIPHDAVTWEVREEAWLPVIGEEGTAQLVPVWDIKFQTMDPDGRWEASVHAGTGQLLSRRSLLAFTSVDGVVDAQVEPDSPGDPQELIPLEDGAVSAVAGQYFAADTTGADGRFTLDLPEAGRARVTAELRGRRAWVRDASHGLLTPIDTLTVDVPGSAAFRFDDGNSTPAVRDTYYHLGRAHRFIRSLDPGPALALLDRPMQARVDDRSGGCNAYWNGTLLVFYAEGSGCASTARIADVVFHEYGHAVTQCCYDPWEPPGDMNEAFSDYFATSLTDQPHIGRGFFGLGTFLRDVERDRIWPRDANPNIHLQGLILAGALWDLRTSVGAEVADRLFHYARYGAAMSFDDYLLDLLAVDDDDGDLGNGTPHFGAIVAAFRAHGIGDYAVHISHAPLPDLEDAGPTIEVHAEVRSLLGLAPDSPALFYASADTFTRAVPRPTGSSFGYAAEIVAPPPGSSVRYYWAAADTAGHSARLPAGAPDSTFAFFVGRDTIPPVIEHEPMEAITEDADRLTLHASITDNSHRVGPAFVRSYLGDPGAGPRRAHPVHPTASPSRTLWGTADSVATPFQWLGGGEYRAEAPLSLTPGATLSYRLTALDAARNPNEATWPAGGAHTVEVRHGRTLTFEATPGDLSPDAGWEWGVPAAPVSAFSGTRVWATGLAAGYADNASWSLTWGPLDLSGWDRARLEFMHLYRCEWLYDGGAVEWASQPDGPWFPLTPAEGYPAAAVRALDAPGFSGDSQGWQRERFALDKLLGRTIWVRFHFESDARVHDLGWVIDDLTLIAAQARARPVSLHAVECGAACVRLRWQPPPGVDEQSPRFLGYEIHRAEGDGPFGDLPIHPAPLRATEYLDSGLTTGTVYRYRLVALYDEGPSAPCTASAVPAAPELDLDLPEVVYELHGTAQSDTSFLVANRSGGQLRFNTYLGEYGESADSVRLAYPCTGGETPFRTIWDDAADPGVPADLAGVDVRERVDLEIGPVLEIRLRGHAPWPDPADWGGLVLLDTDDNLSTGLAEPNLGADFLVAFGRLAHEAGEDGAAVLLDPSFRALSSLTGTTIGAGSEPVLINLPPGLLGTPSSVRIGVRFASSLRADPYDRAPEIPRLPWLEREPRFGRATAGHPQPVALDFDATGVGNGVHRARLILETNDSGNPLRLIPITLRVGGLVPNDVTALRFDPLDQGLAVSFGLPLDLTVSGVAVERSDAEPVKWSQRTPLPILPDSSGRVSFLDTDVEPGRSYLYRFRVVYQPAGLSIYGPYPASYLPAIPDRLRLYPPRPNPLTGRGSGVELRLDLPESGSVRLEVFDPAGRRIRLLADTIRPAGPCYIRWDGLDGSGHPVRAGVYWLRLATPRGQSGTRLVVVR